MEWHDKGIVIDVRPHGESSAVVHLLTPGHGRHAGLVRGAFSKSMRGVLQPGNSVDARWRGRLADHLGTYSIELEKARTVALTASALAVEGVNAACALAMAALPERESHGPVFEGLEVLLDNIEDDTIWPSLLVRWEAGLLRELGFGLDLGSCAATGRRDNLTWVSPKSGRAVCEEAARPYKDKLLKLPGFLSANGNGEPSRGDLRDGLNLTGHFLDRWVLAPHGGKLPESRGRLLDRLFR